MHSPVGFTSPADRSRALLQLAALAGICSPRAKKWPAKSAGLNVVTGARRTSSPLGGNTVRRRPLSKRRAMRWVRHTRDRRRRRGIYYACRSRFFPRCRLPPYTTIHAALNFSRLRSRSHIQGERAMPRGDKSAYSSRQKRKAEHIESGYEKRGVSTGEAERRAWATVNKQEGGGKKKAAKKSSGRKKTTARKKTARKSSARKSATKKSARKSRSTTRKSK